MQSLVLIPNAPCHCSLQNNEVVKLMERNQTINGQCNLLRIGSYIKIMSGGWMGGSDYTQTCTTVLMDALGAHLLKLDLDGRVAELKQALLDASADMDACSQEAEADDTTKLITDNLLGMWVIHAIVSILALAAACMHKQIAGPGDEVPAPADLRPRRGREYEPPASRDCLPQAVGACAAAPNPPPLEWNARRCGGGFGWETAPEKQKG